MRDFVAILDGAYKISHGLVPHVDFAVPHGAWPLYQAVPVLYLLHRIQPLLLYQFVGWLSILPAAIPIAMRQPKPGRAVAVIAFVAVAALVPCVVEYSDSELAYYGGYNRLGDGFLFLNSCLDANAAHTLLAAGAAGRIPAVSASGDQSHVFCRRLFNSGCLRRADAGHAPVAVEEPTCSGRCPPDRPVHDRNGGGLPTRRQGDGGSEPRRAMPGHVALTTVVRNIAPVLAAVALIVATLPPSVATKQRNIGLGDFVAPGCSRSPLPGAKVLMHPRRGDPDSSRRKPETPGVWVSRSWPLSPSRSFLSPGSLGTFGIAASVALLITSISLWITSVLFHVLY